MDISVISKTLTKRADGVWAAPRFEDISYPSNGHTRIQHSETNSFWFDHRFHCISWLIERSDAKGLLDIGGGNGEISHQLQSQLNIPTALLEPGVEAIQNAKRKNIKIIINSSLFEADFKDNTIGAIGLFDVLEHVEKDHEFLKEVNRILKNRGHLFLTVPAYPWLFSDFDKQVGHYRRYTLNGLNKLLQESGFELVYKTYIFSSLPFPMYVFRALSKLFNRQKAIRRGHFVGQPFVRQLFKVMLSPEKWLVHKGVSIPFGSSCLIVALKNNTNGI